MDGNQQTILQRTTFHHQRVHQKSSESGQNPSSMFAVACRWALHGWGLARPCAHLDTTLEECGAAMDHTQCFKDGQGGKVAMIQWLVQDG